MNVARAMLSIPRDHMEYYEVCSGPHGATSPRYKSRLGLYVQGPASPTSNVFWVVLYVRKGNADKFLHLSM